MKRILLLGFIALSMASCHHCVNLQSPDGTIGLEFRLDEQGTPTYHVTKDGQLILDWSKLGIASQEYDLTQGFSITNTATNAVNTSWETVWGEERTINDQHNELLVALKHQSGLKMKIAFRLYNDGLAFRYIFPKQSSKSLTITDEATEYRFVSDHHAWSIPWLTEYYEGLWEKAPLSQKDTMCSPITLELTNGGYAFVHEAALYDYPAQNLYMQDGALKLYLTPWLNPQTQVTPIKAYESIPFATPWRMLILADDLQELTASRIMLNLNEPCKIEDTSWIKPMKFIGIWWGMHIKTMTWEMGPQHGATTKNMEKYLRFAKEHGIEGVLAEGWNKGWEDWRHFSFTESYPDWDMDYLSRLADSLGVEIVGHNETGGNAADYEKVLEEAYHIMQRTASMP